MTVHPGSNQFVTPLKASENWQPVSVAFGDGIGPEIMSASLKVLLAAGAKLVFEPVEIGEQIYRAGQTSGITSQAWESLRRTRVLYKAPITTPQGGGYKSLNVTIRKSLGLYANVRPCVAYAPFIATKHPGMDVVIIRENEEDLYAGIEHRQTDEVYQCLKLISRPGTEKIVRYAFEYAKAHGRRKVSCFTKDNIMKLTDGLFHKTFDQVGAEYPDIEKDHWIIDIGAAKLAASPSMFDVIVTPNLYGDIISDIAAEIAGSIGLAGTANVGEHGAMFEAIHGSAPSIAGQGIANPSGLLLAGVQMLIHIGQAAVAGSVHNAWLKTIEEGVHTFDVFDESTSSHKVGTEAFCNAVIARLGQEPERFKPVSYGPAFVLPDPVAVAPSLREKKELVGIDVFVAASGISPDFLAQTLNASLGDLSHAFQLTMITNRGVKVWPEGLPETFCTDHWRCRFLARPEMEIDRTTCVGLLGKLAAAEIDFVKTEGLYTFDGEPGFSLGQGQ